MNLLDIQQLIDTYKGSKQQLSDGFHTFEELYKFRLLLSACLFNEWNHLKLYDVHKSKRHSTGEECFGGGWFIIIAKLPTGQISNHYELKYWHLFNIPERELADIWDGHSSNDVVHRLESFLLCNSNLIS